jgi:hypothetical protein
MPFLPLFASSLAGLQRPEGQDSRVVCETAIPITARTTNAIPLSGSEARMRKVLLRSDASSEFNA